jgi:hypothetical protein
LYFNGPPGKGQQHGPVMSDQTTPTAPLGSGYGFSFDVPEQYQKSKQSTIVWAVMQPLPGWNQPNVQFDNTVTIPGNCTPTQTPIAQCSQLDVRRIDRTHISMTAKAHADQGGKITGYVFVVSDKSGKKVFEKSITSSDGLAKVDSVDLKSPGDYNAKVTVKTNLGDKDSLDCAKVLSVSPPEKCKYSPTILATDKDCQPCPYDNGVWIKDETNCRPQISESKEAKNLTQNIPSAASTTAKADDRIEYTIYTTNVGSGTVTTNISESLTDVLEYAQLFDLGGGNFDTKGQVLSWGDVALGPQQTDVRHFVIQVADHIPSTPRAANNPAAYNCLMTNSYGNTIDINVDCPAVKSVETVVKQLPSTGAGENVLFGAALLMMVTYFYARSRQMNKEIKLIRHEFNSGTI